MKLKKSGGSLPKNKNNTNYIEQTKIENDTNSIGWKKYI